MKTRIVLIQITLLCAVMPSMQSARAATIMVTNTNDSGLGSLRQALADANEGDTIDATGVSGTILLTSGELQITHNVTINGPGAGNLAVNGNASSRVFEDFASGVIISGFTITNGFSASGYGGGISSSGGGALTVTNSVISGNFSGIPGFGGSGGGGLYYAGGGTLRVTNSVISGNATVGAGGGMEVDGGTVTITDSTISDNVASNPNLLFQAGGGIASGNAQLTVMNSTVSGNSAGLGGGIYAGGLTVMKDSTISGNVAHSVLGGGGIYCEESLTVSNSTISGNAADKGNGGGIYNCMGTTQIGDTVLNAGASGGTIFNDGGTVTSLGYNLASDAGGGVLTGPGDQINTNPLLGPLQDNGGPTFTHALLPGSPAINVGDPSFTPPPFFDQRGPDFWRVRNDRIDIGSFEVQAGSIPTPTPRPSPTPRPRPTPAPRQ